VLNLAAVLFAVLAGFLPSPPGSIAQNRLVALGGEADRAQWRAVSSKMLVGKANGTTFYQWYLSIYAFRNGAYRLRYRSPADGGPLARVARPPGANIWFPVQDLQIVGTAQLMHPGVQQLVVQSHEMAADCGSSIVTVFTTGAAGRVRPAVSIENPCELRAAIVRSGNGDAIALSGPYYSASAALCCPSKPRATALLRYRDGRWTEAPNYYKVFSGRFPPR
jgi:hypothetical protein